MRTVMLLGVVALLAGCDLDHSKVPSDAKPAHFKRLVSWNSCGATGEVCAEVVIFGSDSISFAAAAQEVRERYEGKGWTVRSFDTPRSHDGMILTDPEAKSCVAFSRFDHAKYRRELASDAPDAERMAEIVAPYSTLVEVVAGCG